MPQTTALFTADDLTKWLRQDVTADAAEIVEAVVWGWLRPLLGGGDRPDVVSDELKAWAVELGGIAYSNPEGLSAYSLEAETSTYDGSRRAEILQLVAGGGATAPGAALAPRGTFPQARAYPDPAERCW